MLAHPPARAVFDWKGAQMTQAHDQKIEQFEALAATYRSRLRVP
jgi:hypothetical protein